MKSKTFITIFLKTIENSSFFSLSFLSLRVVFFMLGIVGFSSFYKTNLSAAFVVEEYLALINTGYLPDSDSFLFTQEDRIVIENQLEQFIIFLNTCRLDPCAFSCARSQSGELLFICGYENNSIAFYRKKNDRCPDNLSIFDTLRTVTLNARICRKSYGSCKGHISAIMYDDIKHRIFIGYYYAFSEKFHDKCPSLDTDWSETLSLDLDQPVEKVRTLLWVEGKIRAFFGQNSFSVKSEETITTVVKKTDGCSFYKGLTPDFVDIHTHEVAVLPLKYGQQLVIKNNLM